VQGLIEEALRRKELAPISLQTVCSGTDAPVIAMEQIAKEVNAALPKGLDLSVKHIMSCENEPFKQAYIARNFPHVPLFKDVVELAETAKAAAPKKGQATTAFGGMREIPQAPKGSLSVMVAGTSCKDFSARKRATGVKLTIEDMGTGCASNTSRSIEHALIRICDCRYLGVHLHRAGRPDVRDAV
jgi:hypothetical protein